MLNIECEMYPGNKIKNNTQFGFDHNMNLTDVKWNAVDFDTPLPVLILLLYNSQRYAAVAVNKAALSQ